MNKELVGPQSSAAGGTVTGTVTGTLDLADGGVWTASAVQIGDIAAGAGTINVAAATTLNANFVTIGEDSYAFGTDTLPAVPGALDITGGSDVNSLGLYVSDGSLLSIDASSVFQLGAAAAYQPGALSVQSGATFSAVSGTIDANVLLDGNFNLQAPQPAWLDTGTDFRITGSLTGTGEIQIGAQTLLAGSTPLPTEIGDATAFAGIIVLSSGATVTLDHGSAPYAAWIMQGATVDLAGMPFAGQTPNYDAGSSELTVGAASFRIGPIIPGVVFAATPDGHGGTDVLQTFSGQTLSPAAITGAVTLNDGSLWNASTVQLGQGAGLGFSSDGSLLVAASDASVPTTLWATGMVAGVDGNFDIPGSTATGTLDITGGSFVGVLSLAVYDGSLIALDAASAMTVGSGAGMPGAVSVDAASEIRASSGTISANLALDGTLNVWPVFPGTTDTGLRFDVTGSLTGNGTIDAGYNAFGSTLAAKPLEIGDASAFAGQITLAPGQELLLDRGGLAQASLSMVNATLDLLGLPFTGQTPSFDPVTGQLTLGGATLNVSPGAFSAAADGAGGTLITEIPCYAAGTRIAVAHGEVAVEALRPGAIVLTHAGRLAPVVWVGQTRIDLARHPKPLQAAPVRICAGAFGPALPRRDLLLSPDHALLIGGALIPARLLVNGASIRRDTGLASVLYVHVELDRHDVLLAEGVPAESYLDTGNRALFAAEAGVRPLFPDFTAANSQASEDAFAQRGCAKLVLHGPHLRDAQARLLERATALGHHLTDAPNLRLCAGSTEIPLRRDGRDWCATLPPDTGRVQLRSRIWVPAHTRPGEDDDRQLGVAISELWLDGRQVALDSAGFAAGWHAAEAAWRWTDGCGHLQLASVRELRFRVALTGTYWRDSRVEKGARRPGGSAARVSHFSLAQT